LAVVYNLASRDGAPALRRAPDGPGMETQGEYVDGPRRSFSGGAGLLSTARDYARFLQMLLSGGALEGVRILSPNSVELMTSNHVGGLYAEVAGPGQGFGLGFRIVEDLGAVGAPGSEGSYGWGGAYHSTYWVDPAERLVVVYLTQVIPAVGLDDHARLRALVYGALVKSGGHGGLR
jgi:CubicO group peptidase (beta-lactamase class C family)